MFNRESSKLCRAECSDVKPNGILAKPPINQTRLENPNVTTRRLNRAS